MIEFKIGLNDSEYQKGLNRAKASGAKAASSINSNLSSIKSTGLSASNSVSSSFGSIGSTGARVFSSVAKKAKGAASSFADSFNRASQSVVGQLALVAGAASFGAGFATNRELERATAEVSTLSATAGTDVEALTMQVREMAAEAGKDGLQAIKALYNAISSGQKPAEALAFLKSASNLATAGVTDLDAATKAMTGTMNAFGPAAGDASNVADTLFSIVDRGSTTMTELAPALANVTPAAAASKLSLNEFGASLATITTVIGDASRSSTKLNALLTAFQKPSAEASRLASELGFDLSQTNLEANGLNGVMAQLRAKLIEVENSGGSSAEALAKLFGSTEAAAAATILAKTNHDAYNSTLQDFNKNTGIAAERAGVMANTVDAKLRVATEKAKLEMQKFFDNIRGGVGDLIDGVGGVEKLGQAFHFLRVGAEAAFQGLVTGAMFMLSGVADALAGVSLAIRTTVKTITGDGMIGKVAKAMFPALKLVDYAPQSWKNSFSKISNSMSEFEQGIANSQKERQRRMQNEAEKFQELYNEMASSFDTPASGKAGNASGSSQNQNIEVAAKKLNDYAKDNADTNDKIAKGDADAKANLLANKKAFDAAQAQAQRSVNSQLRSIRDRNNSAAIDSVETFGNQLQAAHESVYTSVAQSAALVLSRELHNRLTEAASISPVVATRDYGSDAAGRRVIEETDRQLRMSIGYNPTAGGLIPARRESFGVDRLPGFSRGGVIRGKQGNDNLIARVSSGESILTRDQTSKLIAAIEKMKTGNNYSEQNQYVINGGGDNSIDLARQIAFESARAKRMRRG